MWPMQAVIAFNPAQGACQVIQMPMNGGGSHMQGNSARAVDQQDVQQLRGGFQWQSRKQEEEMASLQGHLETLERQKADIQDRWEREKKALTAEIVRYQTLLMTYAIPLEEVKLVGGGCSELEQVDGMEHMQMHDHQQSDVDQAMFHHQQQLMQQQLQIQPAWDNQEFMQDMPAFGGGELGDNESNSLSDKLKRLNGLLSENANPNRQQPADGHEAEGSTDGLGAKSIASTLQAMFPNATVRTQGNANKINETGSTHGMNGKNYINGHAQDRDGDSKTTRMGLADRESGSMADPAVRKIALGLEKETGSEIDDRAMLSLKNLPVRLAMEALQKVADLVQSQGGQCRNLSSILQSVCRKLERWSSGREDNYNLATDRRSEGRSTQSGHPLESAKGDQKGKRVAKSPEADTEQKPKADDTEAPMLNDKEYWTQSRLESLAESRVELAQEGNQWRLRIAMASLDPPLLETGMGRFCAWLRRRLDSFKAEQGPKAAKQCQGDVDFSNNGLSNESLWMLLESLAQYEVQASTLNLERNNLSSAGVLALCEFIQSSNSPVHELRLAHNEIDDDSALDLLRTLKETQPRYPLRRQESTQGGQAVPVWVGLSQNIIADPTAVLNVLQAEGITYSQDASPVQMAKKKCPLLNLYQFQEQITANNTPSLTNDSPKQEKTANAAESASAKNRVRHKQFKEEE
eukprot:TRINITY_DN14_c0_g1_i1.p1 TRINITY_DN14_c0_g1~~TRINITY_DN14_c0_g1_i1.p1  ORF type:complete len:809 (+),score=173.39 TRINITY_DN14_c0_g1_i1:355-2427(+)